MEAENAERRLRERDRLSRSVRSSRRNVSDDEDEDEVESDPYKDFIRRSVSRHQICVWIVWSHQSKIIVHLRCGAVGMMCAAV